MDGHTNLKGALGHTSTIIYDEYDSDEEWVDETKEFNIMQFTGLKDKKGKDIYEGDILWRRGETKVVEYRGASFGWAGIYIDDSRHDPKIGGYVKSEALFILTSRVTEGCEVIGNIYEQPNLLVEVN